MPTTKTKLAPVGQRVLIRLTEPVETTRGGIVIPKTAQNRSVVGKVLAIGDGAQETNYAGKWPPSWLKIGGHVLVGRYAGSEIKLEDLEEDRQDTFIVSIEEILAHVTEP